MNKTIVKKSLMHYVGVNTIKMSKSRLIRDAVDYFYSDKAVKAAFDYLNYPLGSYVTVNFRAQVGDLKGEIQSKFLADNFKYEYKSTLIKGSIRQLLNQLFNTPLLKTGKLIEIPFESPEPVLVTIDLTIESSVL